MHTLEQLRNGALSGATHLKLSEQLTSFPLEILTLASTLEVLDLSNNQLTELPDEFVKLTKLKIFFASNNPFTQLPDVLGSLPELEMIGFKSCQIQALSESCLPVKLRWLILTDNRIERLPNAMGYCSRLEKLMLAGNRLTTLPESFTRLSNLKLLRLSANQFVSFPDALLALPQLAWLAFSGNPFCHVPDVPLTARHVDYHDLLFHEVLGQGASGVIYRASWQNRPFDLPDSIAVKVYKGEVTSDGYPEDELNLCLAAGTHTNLVTPIAVVRNHLQSALVMGLIPESYQNLGQPPSLASCTRDTFTMGQCFSVAQAKSIIAQMRDLVSHLEAKQILHGDLYAHNVLVDDTGHILFGDFGAASSYQHLSDVQKAGLQAIERRALAYFEEDINSLTKIPS